ncbi:MAG: ABC-type nitrate/sulfonate/bicarbonate transport system substrate-binding protein, partial [Oceanospirillaceae bacterium]
MLNSKRLFYNYYSFCRTYKSEFFQRSKHQLLRALFLCLILFSTQIAALDKVKLQLKYLHQFQFAGYYAALEQGYYKTAGLDVEIVEGQIGDEPLQAVVSGDAQFGIG